MSIGGDKMALFDITSEDDLLIDSQLDRASFDLRLSVAFDEHSRVSNARRQEEYKSRQSLAWDSAFFTSAGILDLRELSLVNEGFKNPEDHRGKICEKARELASGEREATESFLDYRVSGKHKLETSNHNTREPQTNISLASRTRMKHGLLHPQMKIGNQQSSRSSETSAQKQEHRLPPNSKPSKLQMRTIGHVLSAASVKPASPRSAFPKNVSSAYTGISSSNAGKRWLSKSLDLKGGYQKKMGGGLYVDGVDSPHKWVSVDCNAAQVSDLEGNRKPHHHDDNKVQLPGSMKQNATKAKRSASPLPGDVINCSKKPSRPSMSSQRLRITETDQSAARSAKRVPFLRSISPETRKRGTVKDCGASGGSRKTNSHSQTKRTRKVGEDDEKENMFCAEMESIPGGLGIEEYVDFTNLFGGLGIEQKGIQRKKASTLRCKAKLSNRVSVAEEAGKKSPFGARASPFRTSAFISRLKN